MSSQDDFVRTTILDLMETINRVTEESRKVAENLEHLDGAMSLLALKQIIADSMQTLVTVTEKLHQLFLHDTAARILREVREVTGGG